MSGDIAKPVEIRPAYSLGSWAQACELSESEVRQAVTNGALILRCTESGRRIVFSEDGMAWLRSLPIAGNG